MAITDAELEEIAEAPLITRTDEGMVNERTIADVLLAKRQLDTDICKVPFGMCIARTQPGGPLGRS